MAVVGVGQEINGDDAAGVKVAKIGDAVQVVIGEGDGWVRSYEALTGKKLWEFDLNPKDAEWPKTRNEVIATPVIWRNTTVHVEASIHTSLRSFSVVASGLYAAR